MKWNLDDVIRDLKAIEGVADVEIVECGADFDAHPLIVSVHGSSHEIRLTGFHCETEIGDPFNAEIEAVELKQNEADEDKEFENFEDAVLCATYARIKDLMNKYGIWTCHNLRNHF